MKPRKNRPGALLHARPHDQSVFYGYTIESAFLDFDDHLGRRVSLYAARCLPLEKNRAAGEKFPVVIHAPGGGQTVNPSDLVYLARHGFAAASFDWQIAAQGRDPNRISQFPAGVVSQHGPMSGVEQMVLPLAVQGAGVVLDWVAQHPHIDARRAGITGISWGGYLTWLVNAYDTRFKAAAPVYGCGGLFNPGHPYQLGADTDVRAYWKQHFDAASLGDQQRSPVCFLSSTNDFFGMNSHADALLNSLKVENRRSLCPNTDHHLNACDSATGIAWFKHYLDNGPAIPKQPALSRDLKPTADESQPVEHVEVWYSPDDHGDDQRCWIMGKPKSIGEVRHAFARVFYASGISLNSALVRFDDKPARIGKSKSKSPAAWTNNGGIGPDGPLTSTQYWRTDLTFTPLKPRTADALDSLWTVARDAYRPGGFCVYFRGLADPRWNTGDFHALLIELDLLHVGDAWPHGSAADLSTKIIVTKQATRLYFTAPAKAQPVTAHPGRIALRVEPSQFEKLPAGTTWRDITAMSISGTMPSNRLIVHRIRKT